jgi:very-short-patch-repair endonuclease
MTALEASFWYWYVLLCPNGLIPLFDCFKPIVGRNFRADFAWPSRFVLVELEGLDHQKPATYHKDIEKYNLYALSGYLLLRFTTRDMRDNPQAVIATVLRALGEPIPPTLKGIL